MHPGRGKNKEAAGQESLYSIPFQGLKSLEKPLRQKSDISKNERPALKGNSRSQGNVPGGKLRVNTFCHAKMRKITDAKLHLTHALMHTRLCDQA